MRLPIPTKYKRGLSNLERLERERESLDRQIARLRKQLSRWTKRVGDEEARELNRARIQARKKRRMSEQAKAIIWKQLAAYAVLAGDPYPVQHLYNAQCKRRMGFYIGPREQKYPHPSKIYHTPYEAATGYIFGVGWVGNLVPFSTGGWAPGYIKIKEPGLK